MNWHHRIFGPLFILALGVLLYLRERKSRRLHAEAHAEADATAPAMLRPKLRNRGAAIGIGLAVFYLLLFRALSLAPPFVWDNKGGPILMSVGFLFLGPFAAGFMTVWESPTDEPWSIKTWIFAPWIPILVNVILALSFAWEGIICVVFIVPPAIISASLGGIAAGLLARYEQRRLSRRTLYSLAALPLLLAVVETKINQPLQIRTVDTSVVIHAPLATVWQNIERVHAIAPSELRASWANTIGFPRPVEATLSHEGIGGIRNASFERGLNFTETITDWVPNQRIVFTIKADTAAIPTTTLDEHVTVGGRFFDVLTGEYELHTLPSGDTLLHLSSQKRLSTDFNTYAAMWSDAVMRDMQSNILYVIRNRCEQQTTSVAKLAAASSTATSNQSQRR